MELKPRAELTLNELESLLEEKLDLPKKAKSPLLKPTRGLSDEALMGYALELVVAYAQRLKKGLSLYRPMNAVVESFHACEAQTRLVCAGNQAGKTQCVLAEIARMFLGVDPHNKRRKGHLRILSVGKDEKFIGQVLWKKLWWPGAFEIVPDENSGLWRAVRPDPNDPTEIDPIDTARRKLWMPSPPLLPPESINWKKSAWIKKNAGIPSIITATKEFGESEWMFHASGGYPRNGIELDVFHCSEEIENNAWIPEGRARLLRRNGIMIADYTPQASTPQYFEMHLRAEEGDPDVKEFTLSVHGNPYLPKVAKEAFYNALKHDPDELDVRYYGKYAIMGRKIYPEFHAKIHGVEPIPGGVPKNWMRMMFVDPGTTASGALFVAIAPPEKDSATPKHVRFYDELFLKHADARKFAAEVYKRTRDYHFEAFIIDKKGGMQTPMGFSNTVAEHYTEAFEAAGVTCRRTGSHFLFGSDNVNGREMSLKQWLTINGQGEVVLQVEIGNCPHFVSQIKARYMSKTHADRRDDRTPHEQVDLAEYAAAFFDKGLYYVAPPSEPEPEPEGEPSSWDDFQAEKRKWRLKQRGAGNYSIRLGPGDGGWENSEVE